MTLQDSRIEELNIDLILALLIHICKSPPGAVLVFLPGMGDITKLIRAIEHSGNFPRQRFEIYPLHSKLPTLDQRRIFDRPPPHIRKIIIATNIAETSITIDDIVYVIDCGRIKITGLNVDENIQTLQNEFVSKANLMQRYFLFQSCFFLYKFTSSAYRRYLKITVILKNISDVDARGVANLALPTTY